MNERRRRRRWYWTCAALWTACIYATLYAVRPVCEFLKRTTPFALGVNILAAGVLMSLIVALRRKERRWRRGTPLLLAGVILCYGYGLANISLPEEKIHFIEYGFLAYLILRALRLDCPAAVSYAAAFALTSSLGWIDEGIQHFLPNRYYQTTDVILNSVSAALGLLMTFVFQREESGAKEKP